MTYIPPTRTGSVAERTVFAAAQDYLPKRVSWAKGFTEAHAAFEEASARLARAHRMVAAGRGLLKDWEAAKAAHDDAQAETVGPEDFTPYAVPRPDPDFVLEVARTFERARVRAGRALTLAAPSIWPTLESAWLHHSAPVPETVTVAEARVAELTKSEAKKALGYAALAVIEAQGCSDLERKRAKEALREGRLISLAAIRDVMAGRTPERLAQEAKAQEAKAAQKAEDSAYATEAAKARMAGAKGEK
jgi:hypothetical protein